MELGRKILEIRKTHNMTQEDFAEKYSVTRQTISNWENSKSYPDIETLVKISDDFNISLDVLLKEDRKVVEDISKDQKNSKNYKNIILGFVTVLAICMVAFIVYFGVYSKAKHAVEGKFQNGITQNNFKESPQGWYILNYDENISFEVPHQTMPNVLDFSLDFHAKYVDAYIKTQEEDTDILIRWNDHNAFTISLIDVEGNVEQSQYFKKSLQDLSEELQLIYNANQSLIDEAIGKGENLYDNLYK